MNSMYIFGCLLGLLVAFQGTTAITPTIIKRCVNSTQVEVLELALLYGTEFRIVSTPTKCYISCLFESVGFVSNGVISEDFAIMTKNPKEEARYRKLMETCNNSNVEGECEASYQAIICWLARGKQQLKAGEQILK